MRCTRLGHARLGADDDAWQLERALLDFLEARWREPDDGHLGGARRPRRHFTHSKVMAWVAAGSRHRAAEQFELDGPLDRWRALRDDDPRRRAAKRGSTTAACSCSTTAGTALDASLLLVPHRRVLAGRRSACRPHGRGDPARAQRRRLHAALRRRADSRRRAPRRGRGVPAVHVLAGRQARAAGPARRGASALRAAARPAQRRRAAGRGIRPDAPSGMLGNFPQAFSHVALVTTAAALSAEATLCSAAPHRTETNHDRAIPLTTTVAGKGRTSADASPHGQSLA